MTLTSQQLHQFLQSRRSVRRFTAQPVEEETLKRILTTATFAPSAHNRQPWRFCLITGAEEKKRLADEMANALARELQADGISPEEILKRTERSQKRINGAPVAIVLCAEMSEMDVYADRRRKKAEFVIAAQSAANAGLQLLLAAHAEGLGGVWVCSPLFAQAAVQTALHLPAAWEAQALFLLGYPAETPQPKERKPLDEIVKTFHE
ncbi:MAG: nitroreductase family protein [Anaerolineales bacterium]